MDSDMPAYISDVIVKSALRTVHDEVEAELYKKGGEWLVESVRNAMANGRADSGVVAETVRRKIVQDVAEFYDKKLVPFNQLCGEKRALEERLDNERERTKQARLEAEHDSYKVISELKEKLACAEMMRDMAVSKAREEFQVQLRTYEERVLQAERARDMAVKDANHDKDKHILNARNDMNAMVANLQQQCAVNEDRRKQAEQQRDKALLQLSEFTQPKSATAKGKDAEMLVKDWINSISVVNLCNDTSRDGRGLDWEVVFKDGTHARVEVKDHKNPIKSSDIQRFEEDVDKRSKVEKLDLAMMVSLSSKFPNRDYTSLKVVGNVMCVFVSLAREDIFDKRAAFVRSVEDSLMFVQHFKKSEMGEEAKKKWTENAQRCLESHNKVFETHVLQVEKCIKESSNAMSRLKTQMKSDFDKSIRELASC